MDRRDLLKFGALASVSGSGCAALLGNPGSVTSAELPGFLTALDSAMTSVATGDFFSRLMGPPKNAEIAERAKKNEELTKKTMRSMLLVGTLSELPPEQLADETVQKRLRESMSEFDDAMFGMSSMLENLSSTERADIGKALRDDPNLGMRLMGAVDEEAASFGVSFTQRTKLRGISSQVTSRLRQSPDLVTTEYVGKMAKIATRHGGYSQFQREAATSMTAQMIWQGTATGGGTNGELSPPPPPPPSDQQVPPQSPPLANGQGQPFDDTLPPEKKRTRASHVLLTAGGIALGLGVAVFGIGFAVNGAGIYLGVTFGVLLGVAGLICLLIGLILLAAGK